MASPLLSVALMKYFCSSEKIAQAMFEASIDLIKVVSRSCNRSMSSRWGVSHWEEGGGGRECQSNQRFDGVEDGVLGSLPRGL